MGVKVRSSDLRKTILALEDKLADTPKELEAYEDLEDLIKLWKSFLEETKLKEDRPPKPKKEKKPLGLRKKMDLVIVEENFMAV